MYRRIVFAAAQTTSFEDATKALCALCDLHISPKRVWRAAQRIGEERIAEQEAAVARYQELPLPARDQSPIAQTPTVVCVQMDGGRFQFRERVPSVTTESAPHTRAAGRTVARVSESSPAAACDISSAESSSTCWQEFKAGALLRLHSEVHETDPCPVLPATFADPGKMRELAREIKGFTSEAPAVSSAAPARESLAQADAPSQKPSSASVDDHTLDPDERADSTPWRPEILVRSVVATSRDVQAFGPMLASAAYERGFHAAQRKGFVADGASANWGVHRRWFSHYIPILDVVHALMYAYAAAMAGRSTAEGWSDYRDWAQWVWGGEVERVIDALRARQATLGPPEKGEQNTPRAELDASLTYLENQRGRMRYPEYRRQGLPVTSCAIESTIKQINRRIKGSEKFWDAGADPMLQLTADHLSQTDAQNKFWDRRTARIAASASYQSPA